LKKFREEKLETRKECREKIDLPPITGPQEFFIQRDYED